MCILRHRRDYDEQRADVVVKHHYQGCQLNAKRASTPKDLRGFCEAVFRVADNRINAYRTEPLATHVELVPNTMEIIKQGVDLYWKT